jgi:DnaJ-class molecular chaperone
MTHYQTLGIDKDATQDEIKKAYRRLASKHHPDKGGDPEQFRAVQEAYEVLGDPEARGQYDNPAPHSIFDFVNVNTSEFGSIFSEERFNRERGRGTFRNPDATVGILITAAQAYSGADLTVDTGFSKENIRVAPGVRDGTRIRISQKGYHRFKDVPPGDLVIRITIEYPDNVMRDNDDIHQIVDVDAFDAMLGGEIIVTHFAGKQLKVKIPQGSQQGTKLRLGSWGMPNPNAKTTGNLFLILNIRIPNITMQVHIDLLNKIKSEVKA